MISLVFLELINNRGRIINESFFDLDGVLANFNKGVEDLCGIPRLDQTTCSEEADTKMWNAVREVEHFYYKLELMPGAKELFDATSLMEGVTCEILTAIPKEKRGILNAGIDKTNWVHDKINQNVKVNICYKEEKMKKCTGKDCILIDDLLPNIQAWEEAGGTGILFTGSEAALDQIREFHKKIQTML